MYCSISTSPQSLKEFTSELTPMGAGKRKVRCELLVVLDINEN